VFTQQSNIPEPKDLLALVNEAFVAARKKKDSLGDEKPEEEDPQLRLPTEIKIDNLYAQLYPADGKVGIHSPPLTSRSSRNNSVQAIPHIDAFLSWVASVTIGTLRSVEVRLLRISLSVGGACDFQFGKDAKNLTHSVKVNSGDVVLINGGKVYHSVPKVPPSCPSRIQLRLSLLPVYLSKIYADCAPSWWLAAEVPTHGFARCNIQCRDTSATDPATPESWKQLYV